MSARIEQEGPNVDLLLQRGEAYRSDGEFRLALADIAAAERLEPDKAVISLARSLTLYDAGQAEAALAAVQKFLHAEPAHANGLLLRAHCYLKLRRPSKAAPDFDAAIRAFAEPSPDLFVERARLRASLGQLAKAVEGLDEGLRRLGPVPSLQQLAIDYERQQAHFDAALARVEELIARAPANKPRLLLRAEVLEQAGRLTEAQESYRKLLEDETHRGAERFGDVAALQVLRRAQEGLARVDGKLARAVAAIGNPGGARPPSRQE